MRRDAGLLVVHEDDRGRRRVYDFATLPVSERLRQSWAKMFAARCAVGGGWTSVLTSTAMWLQLGRLASFIAAADPGASRRLALSPAVWKAYRLSRPKTASALNEMAAVAAFLRQDPQLPTPVRDALSERIERLPAREEAFTPQQFDEIRAVARRSFRTAVMRIERNLQLLSVWRAGQTPEGTDAWLVGETLDAYARTGYPPPWGQPRGVPYRYAKALQGEGPPATWKRLFLGRAEIAALAVLIAAEFGFNATTISELAVPHIVTPVPKAGEGAIYRLELVKRRRGGAGTFESRNIADWGAGSPGRLITQVLAATAPARELLSAAGGDIDRLLVWREAADSRRRPAMKELRAGPFGVGLTGNQVERWARAQGWAGSPLRRLRRTGAVLHRREPGQNTQDTHDETYALREPQVRRAAGPVIAAGAIAAMEAAQASVLRARLTAAPAPSDQPTATVDCTGFTASPLTPDSDGGCQASFLLCTACPNARVHPGHHPRLAYLHRAIGSLRYALPPAVWQVHWQEAFARIDDLRTRLGDGPWRHALAAVTADDRDVIDALMRGHLDG